MRDTLIDFLTLPMPILWLLLLATVMWRWGRLSRSVALAATLLFLAISMPASGKFLTERLRNGAPRFDGKASQDIAAIFVPTGGSFDDGTGRWWPSQGSIARLAAALRLHEQFGLPLIVSGGAPKPSQPPEAETLANHFGLQGPQVALETRARNSMETAEFVAAMLREEAQPRVLLVTSATHIARMSAALRHHGVAVVAVAAEGADQPGLTASDFLPRYEGLKRTRAAAHEYMAIAWYLLTRRLDLQDL